jgi:predicted DNA-binding transcriptional regulator AlpA
MKQRNDLNELLQQVDTLKQKEYFSLNEVRELLNLSDTTIYRYLELGYLNKKKVFGRVWFKGSELIQLIHGGVETDTLSK